ncbi:MAG: Bax inhibitor-1 family protein [Gammaproteobacteria bacterium]|nr:Bax inhibitor-1 family protein [Gammaproteobacteria bacterium]
MARDLRYEENFWGNVEARPQRRQKSRKNDFHEGSVPIAKPGSNQFVAQTWRFFFYALFLCGAGASLAFITPIPFLVLPAAMAVMFISLFAFILLHYAFEEYSGAFYAFLFFATTLGIVLGPQLALIAATVESGMFIICAAAAVTVGMTLMLHNYAWVKASFSLRRISLLGSFLSTALTGLIILGLISLIFPTPLVMLLYGAAGVAVFSLYLVYDVYLLKIGAFRSPVEAAMNLFLDVINLFFEVLRIFIAVKTESKDLGNFGQFFLKRIVPILGIALIVVSFGLLERWIMSWHGVDDDIDDSDYFSPPPAPPQGRLPSSSASAPMVPQGQAPLYEQASSGVKHSHSLPPQNTGAGSGQQTFFGNSPPQPPAGPPASAPPLYQPVYPQTQGESPYGPQQYARQGQFFASQQSTGQNQQAYQGYSQYQQYRSAHGHTPAFVPHISGGQGNSGPQNSYFPPPPYNPALYQALPAYQIPPAQYPEQYQGGGAGIPPQNYYQ